MAGVVTGGCEHPLESVNTAPHEAAPHPERWHAPDGDSTECEVSELVGALVRALQPDRVIETGTAFGYTTMRIAEALMANGHGYLVSLEVDAERIGIAKRRLAEEGLLPGPWVEIREQSSLDYTPDAPIGFALFDSLYELRRAEFLRYKPWLAPGTIVAFHDWTSGLRGHYHDVRADVEQLQDDGLLRAVYLPTPRGLAVCEVTA